MFRGVHLLLCFVDVFIGARAAAGRAGDDRAAQTAAQTQPHFV